MSIASRCIDGGSVARQGSINLLMALLGRHEADRAVPVLLVVPMHERRACDRLCKGLTGSRGRYLRVRNKASENGLSLLTAGWPAARSRHAQTLQGGVLPHEGMLPVGLLSLRVPF